MYAYNFIVREGRIFLLRPRSFFTLYSINKLAKTLLLLSYLLSSSKAKWKNIRVSLIFLNMGANNSFIIQ